MRGHGGTPPKSLDSDENFKLEHTLFCHKSRFVAIFALLRDFWAKIVFFWSSKYILHMLVKFAITRKNDASFAKTVNTRLTKIFMASLLFEGSVV